MVISEDMDVCFHHILAPKASRPTTKPKQDIDGWSNNHSYNRLGQAKFDGYNRYLSLLVCYSMRF